MVFVDGASAQEPANDLQERLTSIRDEMVLVADSLNTELPDKTTLGSQQRITDELRFLVGQFSAGQKSRDQSAEPQRAPGATQSGTTQGSGVAAADSSEVDADAQSQDAELTDMELVLEAWGQMPGEETDQRGSGISPRFLPGYEQVIREYYRRISR